MKKIRCNKNSVYRMKSILILFFVMVLLIISILFVIADSGEPLISKGGSE